MQTELVDRARRGDREAFSVLAGRAVDRLYGIARMILRDTELAEDATQETLVRAWRDLPSSRDAERFDAWMYRLLVRSCADVGRDRRRWRTEVTVLHSEPTQPDMRRTWPIAISSNGASVVSTTRSERFSALNFYVGLSPSETAEALDIPVGTAKSRLHYAIEALRAALAADERASMATVREEQTA